jgi:hypothetical protein
VGTGKDEKVPDPLGKRALFGGPSHAAGTREAAGPLTVALPVGKRALYSGAQASGESAGATSDSPLREHGAFNVRCQRCGQLSRIGLVDLFIFQFPIGMWIPRGPFDRRMTCPSCRKRSWCSVTLRR